MSGQPDTEKLGWCTDRVTRPIILSSLRRRLALHQAGLRSQKTWGELATFMSDIDSEKGKVEYRAATGCQDDRVLSYAIGDYLNQTIPLGAVDDEQLGMTSRGWDRPENKTGY